MQYLLIEDKDTLQTITKVVGSQNVDSLLSENGLVRSPKIGQQWKDKCNALISENPPEVTGSRKSTLLNSLTGSEDIFEKACLMDEDEWKIFSAFGSFKDALRIPETIKLPYSARVMGDTVSNSVSLGNGGSSSSSNSSSSNTRYGDRDASTGGGTIDYSPATTGSNVDHSNARHDSRLLTPATGTQSGTLSSSSPSTKLSTGRSSSSNAVNPNTYRAVMKSLKQSSTIDQSVLDQVNSSPSVGLDSSVKIAQSSPLQYAFDLPWGKIQLYSSLLDELVDIPAYPQELETGRSANYTSMPDIIYQYEPWVVYQSSGPRDQSLSFELHRDMWSGNHLDGRANDLIRFCESNTFPRYSGSAVLSPTVKLYIDGSLFISGILTSTKTRWYGPLGLDNYYLAFELTLNIQEVSDTALNIDTVRRMGLIGG